MKMSEGVLTNILPDGQAIRLGLQVGWRFHEIEGESYSEERFIAFKNGQSNYTVVFQKLPTSDQLKKPLALKCSQPKQANDFEAAMREVDVLKELTTAIQANGRGMSFDAVPRYIAHEVKAGTIWLAMSKLPGTPLDEFIYGPKGTCKHIQKMKIQDMLDGPLENSQLHTRSLQEAASMAAALLEQMAPIFKCLSPIAYHRDIAAHNFLFRFDEDGKPLFGLIDFGLAVKSQSWSKRFKQAQLSGTPHYFPPSTWMMLAYGHKYLESHPEQGFLREYQERLDHFALGVVSLEMLFALEDRSSEADGSKAAAAVNKARVAWRRYWTKAIELFQGFFIKGPNNLRPLLAGGLLTQLVGLLQDLIVKLRGIAATDIDPFVGSVFSVAANLLDRNGTLAWSGVQEALQRGPSSPSSVTPTDARPRTFSHRKVWTLDDASSLTRDVPDVTNSNATLDVSGAGTTSNATTGHRRPSIADWISGRRTRQDSP
jgi:serine/threonine protein kinase